MDFFHINSQCRLCQSKRLKKVIPLHDLPINSPNIAHERLAVDIQYISAPSSVYVCEQCGLLQLTTVVNSSIQYDNFLYETKISLGLIEHFKSFVDNYLSRYSPKNVLDIGSNDGSLLNLFKQKNLSILGIDPAKKISETANLSGIPTITGFFNNQTALEILTQQGKFDLIISNNTVANLDNLADFFSNICLLLTEDGVAVIETQYSVDMLNNFLLDVIYHEHLSYFNASCLHNELHKFGLYLYDAEKISPKGGSIRFYIKKACAFKKNPPSLGLQGMLDEEKNTFNTVEICNKFNKKLNSLKLSLKALLDSKNGKNIYGFGSSVGSIALYIQLELSNYIHSIFDNTPLKNSVIIGKNIIPIINPNNSLIKNPIIVIAAWRYKDNIIKNNINNFESPYFITPLPEIETS